MLIPLAAVLLGLILLSISSDKFVEGAAVLARRSKISPLIIGIVIIGFGTSTPELIVSVFAALQGNPALAVGNALGSNITNIGLILGLIAVISPIRFQSGILLKELPLLSLATLVAGGLFFNLSISRLDGGLLLLLFAAVMFYIVRSAQKASEDPIALELENELNKKEDSRSKPVVLLVGGLILLMISSRIVVWGAVEVAKQLGVSDLLIGLTVVALGTSLPELAAGFSAVRKGEHEFAVGNVVGSNLFNTLAVVGVAGTLSPFTVAPEVLRRDLLMVLLFTFSLFAIGYGHKRHGRINRVEGVILLGAYLFYLQTLIRPMF
jgi:cation:H+ antiporter